MDFNSYCSCIVRTSKNYHTTRYRFYDILSNDAGADNVRVNTMVHYYTNKLGII